MTTTRQIEEAVITACQTIRRHWDATLDTAAPSGSVAVRSPGRGALADDQAETDADMSALDRRVSLRREVTEQLNAWCRLVVEERDLRVAIPDGLDAKAMCVFLERHARWMSGHEAGPDCADEMHEWARKVQRLAVPRRREWLSIGTCPVRIACDGEAIACGTQVRIYPDHPGDIRCAGCGTTDTLDGWVLKMVGSEGPFTAVQLLPHLHRRMGIVVKPSAIRVWVKRGVIRPPVCRTESGENLYDLRTVLTDLAYRQERGA